MVPAESGPGVRAPLRVILADDHPMFRAGLRMVLESDPDVVLVGEAKTGLEAVRLAGVEQPDVIVMDLNMPDLNGVEATRQIVAGRPSIGILVLTMIDDDESVFAAMRAGARGYLLKGAGPDEVLRAVRAVAQGTAVFGPSIARRLIDYFATVRPQVPDDAFPELTDREREILDLVAAGERNPVIAQKLFLSPKTVRNHVSNIFSKLQVADRSQAIVRAREAGLGQPRL